MIAMPMTRSELMYFSAGMVAGAFARSAYPQLKEKFGPLLAGALAGTGGPLADAYAEVAKTVAEKVESFQDAMAEMNAASTANATPPVETAQAA